MSKDVDLVAILNDWLFPKFKAKLDPISLDCEIGRCVIAIEETQPNKGLINVWWWPGIECWVNPASPTFFEDLETQIKSDLHERPGFNV